MRNEYFFLKSAKIYEIIKRYFRKYLALALYNLPNRPSEFLNEADWRVLY